MLRIFPSFVLGCLGLVLLPAPDLLARDHFLTIGGGYSPMGNQASLEKNVLMMRELVAEKYPDGAPHAIFFSDGNSPSRDLQFHDPAFSLPRANLLLARLFGGTKYLEYQYRSHKVPGVTGGTTRENLARWFEKEGSKLGRGDRLFIYVTAHGGKSSDKKNPHNTALYLWNSQKVLMSEFASYLDKVSADVPVIVVMVQCYGGGFANILFKQGDPQKGLARGNRCGFYATIHTRPAAGCTPSINEETYQEYSSFFWAALRGKSRTGKVLADCDYDGNGVVSFAEAHAYAVLTSATIDIPVATSDAFLRVYSTTKSPPSTKPGKEPKAAGSEKHLLTPDSPFADLVALATPADRAILEGLSHQLGLKSPQRAREAKELANQISRDNRNLSASAKKTAREMGRLLNEMRQAVLNRWPELANRWHPRVEAILHDESADVIKLIETHKNYSRCEQLRKELNRLSTQKEALDYRWVKCQRLIRALENVALAANLSQVASVEMQQRYHRLREAENGYLGLAGTTVQSSE
jgi:hypothetical protein